MTVLLENIRYAALFSPVAIHDQILAGLDLAPGPPSDKGSSKRSRWKRRYINVVSASEHINRRETCG